MKLERKGREKIWEIDRDCKRNNEKERDKIQNELTLTSLILPFHSEGSYSGRDSKRDPRREKDQPTKGRKKTLGKKPPPAKRAFFPFCGLSEEKFYVESLLLDGFFNWAQKDCLGQPI